MSESRGNERIVEDVSVENIDTHIVQFHDSTVTTAPDLEDIIPTIKISNVDYKV